MYFVAEFNKNDLVTILITDMTLKSHVALPNYSREMFIDLAAFLH